MNGLKKRHNIEQLKIPDSTPDGEYLVKIVKSGDDYTSTLIADNSGDAMTKAVYDTNNREEDVFDYAKKMAIIFG